MEGTSSTSRVWILWIALAAVAICAASGFVAYTAWKGEQPQRNARAGLTAMNTGDYTSAQRYLAQAVREARTPQDRAAYEMLLAASLEQTSADQAADHYLSVINDAALPEATRATAGVYLLMLLNVQSNPALTKAVFERSPWSALYHALEPDERINAELATIKAHEAILTTYPNFMSYLFAGEFYARSYPYLTGTLARLRTEYAAKAADYFTRGTSLLRDARDTGQWDKTRIALGYALATSYAVELLDNKLGSMDERTLRAFYLEAAGFADAESNRETLMERARLSIRLAYAGHLIAPSVAVDHAANVKVVAGELADLAAEPVNRPLIAKIMNATDPSSKYGRLKAQVLFMASSSPALEEAVKGVVTQ